MPTFSFSKPAFLLLLTALLVGCGAAQKEPTLPKASPAATAEQAVSRKAAADAPLWDPICCPACGSSQIEESEVSYEPQSKPDISCPTCGNRFADEYLIVKGSYVCSACAHRWEQTDTYELCQCPMHGDLFKQHTTEPIAQAQK